MNFIFHGDNGAYFGKVPSILEAVAHGTPGPQIMATTFPSMTLEQLGKRIADFKGNSVEQSQRGLRCPLPVWIRPDRLPDERDPREEAVAPQEIARLRAALDRLPHGDRLPSWYSPEKLAGH